MSPTLTSPEATKTATSSGCQAWRSARSTVVAPAAPAERLRRRLDPAPDHQARRAFVEAGTCLLYTSPSPRDIS
ncbi:hypothetical protein KZ846_32385, partial [Pseudomonas aeruginosa]|nr:hypothetical protein [Pseudomonas aeruginosa]